jgi:hypothetical protein
VPSRLEQSMLHRSMEGQGNMLRRTMRRDMA